METPKVLIVEDNKQIAKLLRSDLIQFGYDVCSVVPTGEEAVRIAEEIRPDLVLMDIVLEGELDGIQAADRIRAFLDIPVIYLTAHATESLLDRAQETAPYSYLLKPFRERELKAAIQIALYRKRMEKLLKASEKKYRELAELLPQIVFETDREMVLTFVNRNGLEALGYKPDVPVQDLRYFDSVVPEHRSSVGQAVDAVLAGENQGPVAYSALRNDGSTFPVAAYFNPIINEGLTVGVRGIAFDTTQQMLAQQALQEARDELEERIAERTLELSARKRAEEALLRAKERWERTFDAVPDLLTILDADFRVAQLNRAAAQRLGIEKSEAVGKHCSDLLQASDCPQSPCPNRCFFIGGEHHEGEIEEPRLGGTFHVTTTPLHSPDGRSFETVHVARDVTERKLYERKLEQLVQEIRQFAYIVSHDLREPLRNIKGFSDELERLFGEVTSTISEVSDSIPGDDHIKTLDLLKQDLDESLQFIGSSVSRMDQLVGAVLSFSRIGYQELFPERLNTKELVDETLALFAHRIKREGIVVKVRNLPDIIADRNSASQIFANLLSNAINYLDPARPGQIHVTAQTSGDHVTFRVTDNGIGIDDRNMQRIFEMFKRIGEKDVPGEGMGLAYVRTLVRRHGGRLWCESEHGRGSSFLFTIPDHASAVQ